VNKRLFAENRFFPLKNAGAGVVLGLGAPLGYVLFSMLFLNPENQSLVVWLAHLVRDETMLMLYLTVPTVFVFTAFGFYHGLQEAKLDYHTKEMERFLNVVAHDVASPLTVIKDGVAQISEGLHGQVTDAQHDLLENIRLQESIVTELVRELLDLQRIESGRYRLDLEPQPLVMMVEKAVSEMGVLIKEKKARVVLDVQAQGVIWVNADAFKFRQVLRNVLGNALKHIPNEGAVYVQVKLSEEDATSSEVVVRNEGASIPEDKLKVIFDKFIQADKHDQRSGFGLGLCICRDIIEMHRGKIWAENVKPSGVAFHFTLPTVVQGKTKKA